MLVNTRWIANSEPCTAARTSDPPSVTEGLGCVLSFLVPWRPRRGWSLWRGRRVDSRSSRPEEQRGGQRCFVEFLLTSQLQVGC